MTDHEAQEYCARITKSSGSNFYYSFYFLSSERREAMYAVYAFCKEVDASVDDAPPGSAPTEALARWRAGVSSIYHPEASTAHALDISPIIQCLAHHVRRLDIPEQYFLEVIAGVEMDVTVTRYGTFQDLYTYCYRVASVVGLICLRIFGARPDLSTDYAENLGVAFQLTNILRDLKTDGARGRVYLPQEDLARFGVTERDLLNGAYTPAFIKLMKFECRRAQDYYADALAHRPESQREALLPAEIMRGIYQDILARIETSGYRTLDRRITVSPARRLAIALRTWLQYRLKLRGA